MSNQEKQERKFRTIRPDLVTNRIPIKGGDSVLKRFIKWVTKCLTLQKVRLTTLVRDKVRVTLMVYSKKD